MPQHARPGGGTAGGQQQTPGPSSSSPPSGSSSQPVPSQSQPASPSRVGAYSDPTRAVRRGDGSYR
jgi:hypothetical protein